MKIAVMGAGAVGSFYGARLAETGHDVTLIGRPAHVEAFQQNGLVFESGGTQRAIPISATAEPSGVADTELVLFCVKSGDTESAGAAMLPFLVQDTAVWTLQNGVDNAERLAKVLGRDVQPTAVYVAADMGGPGHVRHHGRGDLVVGQDPRNSRFVAAMIAAGIPVAISDNVIGALWAKLVINCGCNALSAISQLPYGYLTATDGVEQVMRDLVSECQAVAERIGVTIPGDSWNSLIGVIDAMPLQYSSTAQDMARGRVSEIDHLNGYVVRKGDEFGVDVRSNRAMLALVKLIENGRTQQKTGLATA